MGRQWLVALGVLLVFNQIRGETLGTWNVRNWSEDSRSDSEVGVIRMVSRRYDVVALQEVLDVEAVDKLITQLGSGWDRVVSDQVGTNKKERMAFIFKTSAFELVDSWVYANGASSSFEREPFCVHLRALPRDLKDLVICTIHVVFGDSLQPRRDELKALADVMESAETRVPSAAPVLCGDFNMPPNDAAWGDLRANGYSPVLEDLTYRTTIGDVSLYDNIWVTSDFPLAPSNGAPYVFEFDELMFSAREVASRVVSDHRPVSVIMGSSSASSPGPDNSQTAGTSGFSSLPRGGLSVGSFGAVDRSVSPWMVTDAIGPAATLMQHFDVLALVGGSITQDEASRVAAVLATDFEAGSYVAEYPFLYSVTSVQRTGSLFDVASGGATCSVFISNTAEFTLCALGAGADASVAETTYTEALASANTRGEVLVAGTFNVDVSSAAFDGLRSAGATSLVSSTLISQTDGTGQLRDTLFGSDAFVTGGKLLDARLIPFDEWFYPPSTSTADARELSTRRPSRLLIDNGGGFTAAPNCNLFIAKYVEGKAWNKAIALYNPSASPAPLEFIRLRKITNGETSWADATALDLGSGVLRASETLVVAHPSADAAILDVADVLLGGMTYTGNDAMGIECDGQMVDVVGFELDVVANGWRVGDVEEATKDAVLARKPYVSAGVGADWATAAGENRHNAQYDVLQPTEDHLSGLGFHYVDSTILGKRTTTLFISEYLESDTGFDKAVELFNPSEYNYVDLSGYSLIIGGRSTITFGPGAGVLSPQDTFTVAHSRASDEVRAHADLLDGSLNFNGDDSVVLAVDSGATVVDSVGYPDAAPLSGDGYDVGDVSDATVDHSLVRKPTVAYGNGGAWERSASTGSPVDSEWEVRDISLETLGSHEFEGEEAAFCSLFPGKRLSRSDRPTQARGIQGTRDVIIGGTPEQTPYCCGSDANCPDNSSCDTSKNRCVCDEGRDGATACAEFLEGEGEKEEDKEDKEDGSRPTGSSSSSAFTSPFPSLILFVLLLLSLR